jgi:uncharacterized membrane protein
MSDDVLPPERPDEGGFPERVARKLAWRSALALDTAVRELEGWEPAWRRGGRGERRWPATIAMLVAIVLQLALPERFVFGPRWFLPTLQGLLAVFIIAGNPVRIERHTRRLRVLALLLVSVVTFGNAFSAFRLVRDLINGTEGQEAGALLGTGAAIWLTNVLVFAFWYWEADRGGPAVRAQGTHAPPAFLFAQMQSPELAPPEWRAEFVDYLYLSFTNATAFSPTDVLPLLRWAKLTMMAQSLVSLGTVALVVARAVNILR